RALAEELQQGRAIDADAGRAQSLLVGVKRVGSGGGPATEQQADEQTEGAAVAHADSSLRGRAQDRAARAPSFQDRGRAEGSQLKKGSLARRKTLRAPNRRATARGSGPCEGVCVGSENPSPRPPPRNGEGEKDSGGSPSSKRGEENKLGTPSPQRRGVLLL